MSSWSDTITGTGLIATLVAILFAIAATFITRRRQLVQQLTAPPSAEKPSSAKPSAPRQEAPRITPVSVPGPATPAVMSPVTPSPGLTTISPPLFKKLGSRGIEDPHVEPLDSQTYVWE